MASIECFVYGAGRSRHEFIREEGGGRSNATSKTFMLSYYQTGEK